MHKKDYIQRQFEEFGKVLASLLLRRKNKEWEAFEKEIEEASKKFTSLELSKIGLLGEEQFKKEILQTSALLYDQKKILANLFFEKMNACQERLDDDGYGNCHAKCLFLYEHLAADLTQNEYDLEVHYRLEFLRKTMP